MTEAEQRILQNQIEIMWTFNLLMGKLLPDLVGRGGELDRMRDDLSHAANSTKALISRSTLPSEERGGDNG